MKTKAGSKNGGDSVGRFLDIQCNVLPERALLTDDPLRAKMMAAHHLEQAELAGEQRGMYCYTGFYNGVPLTVMSVGFGEASLLAWLDEAFRKGVTKAVYVGECAGMSNHTKLGEVVIAESAGGIIPLGNLEGSAIYRSGLLGIPVRLAKVVTDDRFWLKDRSIKKPDNLFIDFATNGFYKYSRKKDMQALSILTVSEILNAPLRMEESQRQSGFHNAIRVAYETIVS